MAVKRDFIGIIYKTPQTLDSSQDPEHRFRIRQTHCYKASVRLLPILEMCQGDEILEIAYKQEQILHRSQGTISTMIRVDLNRRPHHQSSLSLEVLTVSLSLE